MVMVYVDDLKACGGLDVIKPRINNYIIQLLSRAVKYYVPLQEKVMFVGRDKALIITQEEKSYARLDSKGRVVIKLTIADAEKILAILRQPAHLSILNTIPDPIAVCELHSEHEVV